MQPHVDGLESRGVQATPIDLPLRRAELAVPAYRQHVEQQTEAPGQLVIAGQSYGGRVASLLAAEPEPACAALICFSYPLHRPGQPDWDVRSRHWPAIDVPALFLSGESDPFARIDLLRRAIDERLPSATLVTYPSVGSQPQGSPRGRPGSTRRLSSSDWRRSGDRVSHRALDACDRAGGTSSDEPLGSTRTIVSGASRRTSWANWWGGSIRVEGRIQRRPTG